MKKGKILPGAFLIITLFFLLSPVKIKGDIYIKKIKHTDDVTIMGRTEPARDEKGETWISKDKFRADEGNKSTIIVRLDLKKMYIINHQTKTYSEADIPINIESILSPQAKQMMQAIEVSAKVTDTGESQNIKKWNCKKYIVELNASLMGINMIMTQETWVSKKAGVKLELYERFKREILSLNPLIKTKIEDIQKIEGYPVITKSTMNIMGIEKKAHEEVVSVGKKDAPEGTYDLPQGYIKSAYNPFDIQK